MLSLPTLATSFSPQATPFQRAFGSFMLQLPMHLLSLVLIFSAFAWLARRATLSEKQRTIISGAAGIFTEAATHHFSRGRLANLLFVVGSALWLTLRPEFFGYDRTNLLPFFPFAPFLFAVFGPSIVVLAWRPRNTHHDALVRLLLLALGCLGAMAWLSELAWVLAPELLVPWVPPPV